MPGSRIDPYRAYDFKLDINGITEGHFTECVGIGIEVEAVSYREAGQGQIVRRLPGQVTYSDINLRYGLTDSRTLWDWFQQSVAGTVERKNVSIIQLSQDGSTETMRWDLEEAWPTKWLGPNMNALSREIAIEELVLVCENIIRS